MARTAVATLQVVWDCRWSQPGHRLTNVLDAEQPESRWVCTRDGHRRSIDEHECEGCAHWELTDDAAVLSVASAAAVAAGVAAPAVPHAARTLDVASRVVTLLTAILLAASGFTLLTGPLMIPFVVVLWLGAAAFGAFTFYGRFPIDTADEDTASMA
jgi:hypothetical protein